MIVEQGNIGVDFDPDIVIAGETLPNNYEYGRLAGALGLSECIAPYLGSKGASGGGQGEQQPEETATQRQNRLLRESADAAVKRSKEARERESGQ